jgi:hypothetical protein
VERGSDKHGRLLDEQLDHETRSLRQGAPVESRADDRRVQEDGGDDDPVVDALLTSGADFGGLSHDEIEARSDLARHLQPSIFPARREALIASATALGASPALIDALSKLPEATYENVQAVWAALGGHTESRDHEVRDESPRDEVPRSGAPAPEASEREAAPRLRFSFRFDPLFRPIDALLGVSPRSAFVEVDDARFVAQFGRWRIETPRSNVVGAEVSGPYSLVKVIGPPRLSAADRGLTFATTAARGVCVRFREPVKGIEPIGVVRHPGLTVTVEDPDALVAALSA